MNWEETILKIREIPAFYNLVEKAYLQEDIFLNINRFRKSEEFNETIKKIRSYFPDLIGKKILDLGAGNGIATFGFALEDMEVHAVEPCPSETVGYKAIQKVEEHYKTGKVKIYSNYGESLPFESGFFDVVYIRQAMHHASDLFGFVKESARVLKKHGVLFTVRDHVIYNEQDKKWFLETHPLHKFYGGENAFKIEEYLGAISSAGLSVKSILRHYDNVINYYPESVESLDERIFERNQLAVSILKKKLSPIFSSCSLLVELFKKRLENKLGPPNNESKIPGRHISFIAIKEK